MDLNSEDMRIIRSAMRADFFYFVEVMNDGEIEFPFSVAHELLVREVFESKYFVNLILIWRKFGKSTLFLDFIVPYMILMGMVKHIVIGSQTEDVAKDFLEKIKIALLKPNCKKYFGNVKGKWWSTRRIMVSNEALNIECYVQIKGTKSQIAGLNMSVSGKSIRPELYIGDDFDTNSRPPSDKDIENQLQWYYSVLHKSMASKFKSRIFFVGTTYNPRSFYTELQKDPEVHVLKLPALNVGENHEEITKLTGVPYGRSLWESHPEFCTAVLGKEFEESKGIPIKYDTFFSQYVMMPGKKTRRQISEDDVVFVPASAMDFSNLYLLIDGAYSKDSTTDPIAIVLCGKGRNGSLLYVDGFKGYIGQELFHKTVLEFFDKYNLGMMNNFKGIGIESIMYEWVASQLTKFLKSNHLSPVVFELRHGNRPKHLRMERLILPAQSKLLHIVDNPSGRDFCNQLTMFNPLGSLRGLDDVDVFAYLLDDGIAAPMEVNKKEAEPVFKRDDLYMAIYGKTYDEHVKELSPPTFAEVMREHEVKRDLVEINAFGESYNGW